MSRRSGAREDERWLVVNRNIFKWYEHVESRNEEVERIEAGVTWEG